MFCPSEVRLFNSGIQFSKVSEWQFADYPLTGSGSYEMYYQYRAPLITPFCFPTWAFFQLRRYQNTHLAMLNSVFGALYLKKNTCVGIPKGINRGPRTQKTIEEAEATSSRGPVHIINLIF
jgi:hypothetical protein